MELRNKVAVITGATRGLGKALAEDLKAAGMTVIASGRTESDLKALAENGFDTFAADVTDSVQVEALADYTMQKYGRIDMWFNNAGIWVPHPIVPAADVTVDDTKTMMDVNLYGLMNGTRAALSRMRRQGSGTIVNIISTSGIEGRDGSAGYCASKFAANGYSLSVRAELAANSEPVSMLVVHPGGTKTELFGSKMPLEYDTFMEPDHVAKTIVENLERESPEEDLVIRRPTAGKVSAV